MEPLTLGLSAYNKKGIYFPPDYLSSKIHYSKA